MARKWAGLLRNSCRLRGLLLSKAGGRIRNGPQVGRVAIKPLQSGGVPCASERGGTIKSGLQLGHPAHLWAIPNSIPRFEAVGPPEPARAM